MIIYFLCYLQNSNTTDGVEIAPLPQLQPPSTQKQLFSQESSSPTMSFVQPPSIMDKLDLNSEEYTKFLNAHSTLEQTIWEHDINCENTDLITRVVTQIPCDIDKEVVYAVMMRYIGKRKITKNVLPQLIYIATCIVMNRKVVSDIKHKKILDKRFDINSAIKTEFRNVRLVSKEAHKIRQAIINFLNKIDCVLTNEIYNELIKLLVRGYGVITRLYTIDDSINDACINLNNGYCQDNELIQYGFIVKNDNNIWVPSLKAKLYSYIKTNNNNPFIEKRDRLSTAIKELRGCKHPKHHADLHKEGYIEYSPKFGWQLTNKKINLDNIQHMEILNINDNDLYNDILARIKNMCNDNYELYAQNIYQDIKNFIKDLYGNLSLNDYQILIANICKAFSIL